MYETFICDNKEMILRDYSKLHLNYVTSCVVGYVFSVLLTHLHHLDQFTLNVSCRTRLQYINLTFYGKKTFVLLL